MPIVGILGGFLGGWFGKGVVVTSRRLTPSLVKRPFLTGAALGLTLALIAIISFGESYGGGYSQAKTMLEMASPQNGEVVTVSWYYLFAKAGASFRAWSAAFQEDSSIPASPSAPRWAKSFTRCSTTPSSPPASVSPN